MNRYYNKLEALNRPKKERKMKKAQTVVFKRYGRWYYNRKSITHRHPQCSENGYMLRIVALWKGKRRMT